MKRCPKCSRSYPDENQKFCTFDGGLLVSSDSTFDPNATMALPETMVERRESPGNRRHDPAATMAGAAEPTGDASATPTVVTGGETIYERAPVIAPPPPPPPKPATPSRRSKPAPTPPVVKQTVTPVKKSKLPLILGILLLLLLLGAGGIAAFFFLVVKPKLAENESSPPVVTKTETNENSNKSENTNTAEKAEVVAPPNTQHFVNSNADLDGKLAEHFFNFSFYYPNGWQPNPKAGKPGATNFVEVERRLPPDFTQENLTVGWYTSQGTYEADESTFPQLVEKFSANLAKRLPEYRKVSEGPTKVNSLDAYEFRFVGVSKGTEKGDINFWGRVIFLPTGVAGEQSGATLSLLTTSLAPELSGVDDVGVKGEMPVILETFRFGKKP